MLFARGYTSAQCKYTYISCIREYTGKNENRQCSNISFLPTYISLCMYLHSHLLTSISLLLFLPFTPFSFPPIPHLPVPSPSSTLASPPHPPLPSPDPLLSPPSTMSSLPLLSLVPSPPSVINCALGLWRFVEASQHRHDEQFYLYIVLLIVVVLFEVGMGIYHFIAKYIIPDLSKPPKDDTQSPSEDIELTEATNGKNPPQTEKKDKPAPKKRPSRVREVYQ